MSDISTTDCGRVADATGLSQAEPKVSALTGFDPSRDRLQALLDADARCSDVLTSMLEAHKDRDTHAIHCTASEWDASEDAFAARDAARQALMPTEQDAIRLIFEAYTRLKELGWNDPIYCPKDGSSFDVIEAGSTGIFRGHYEGEWPNGDWWIEDQGDICHSRPVLYRVTEAEKAQREEMRRRFRALRDSDGSPKGEDADAASSQTTARAESIAQPDLEPGQ